MAKVAKRQQTKNKPIQDLVKKKDTTPLLKIKKPKKLPAETKQQENEVPPDVQKMMARLDKLDAFVNSLIVAEGTANLTPQVVTEMLLIKARHNAFVHTVDNDPGRTLVWMISSLINGSEYVYQVAKQNAKQVEEPKEEKCTDHQNGETSI